MRRTEPTLKPETTHEKQGAPQALTAAAAAHPDGEHAHQHGATGWMQALGEDVVVSRMALMCLGVNALMSVGKFSVGLWCGSAALLAEASHAAADTAGDMVTLWCLYSARQKPSAAYPLGYGKREALGTLAVGVMMLLSSLGILLHVLPLCLGLLVRVCALAPVLQPVQTWLLTLPLTAAHAHDEEPMDMSALLLVIGSVVLRELMYRWLMAAARRTRSSVLEASARHQRIEVTDSLVSLVALAGTALGVLWFDALGGLVQAVHNCLGAVSILHRALVQLCDGSAPPEVVQQVRNVLQSFAPPCACEVSLWAVIPQGPFLAAYVTLAVPRAVTAGEAVALEAQLQAHISQAMPEVCGYIHAGVAGADTVGAPADPVDTKTLLCPLRNPVRVVRVRRRLVAPRQPRLVEAALGLGAEPLLDTAVSAARRTCGPA